MGGRKLEGMDRSCRELLRSCCMYVGGLSYIKEPFRPTSRDAFPSSLCSDPFRPLVDWLGPKGRSDRRDLNERDDELDVAEGVAEYAEDGDEMNDAVLNDSDEREAEGMRLGVCPMEPMMRSC